MRSYVSHVVLLTTAVVAALISIVAVGGTQPPRQITPSNVRRVGIVAFLVVLLAWFVWLLGAIGPVSWKADGMVMELPWYGWLLLVVLAVWMVGTVDNHWPRYRATKPAGEPEHDPRSRP